MAPSRTRSSLKPEQDRITYEPEDSQSLRSSESEESEDHSDGDDFNPLTHGGEHSDDDDLDELLGDEEKSQPSSTAGQVDDEAWEDVDDEDSQARGSSAGSVNDRPGEVGRDRNIGRGDQDLTSSSDEDVADTTVTQLSMTERALVSMLPYTSVPPAKHKLEYVGIKNSLTASRLLVFALNEYMIKNDLPALFYWIGHRGLEKVGDTSTGISMDPSLGDMFVALKSPSEEEKETALASSLQERMALFSGYHDHFGMAPVRVLPILFRTLRKRGVLRYHVDEALIDEDTCHYPRLAFALVDNQLYFFEMSDLLNPELGLATRSRERGYLTLDLAPPNASESIQEWYASKRVQHEGGVILEGFQDIQASILTYLPKPKYWISWTDSRRLLFPLSDDPGHDMVAIRGGWSLDEDLFVINLREQEKVDWPRMILRHRVRFPGTRRTVAGIRKRYRQYLAPGGALRPANVPALKIPETWGAKDAGEKAGAKKTARGAGAERTEGDDDSKDSAASVDETASKETPVSKKTAHPARVVNYAKTRYDTERDTFLIKQYERHDISFESMAGLFNSRFGTNLTRAALYKRYRAHIAPGKADRPLTVPRERMRSRATRRDIWVIKKREKYNELWPDIAKKHNQKWPNFILTDSQISSRYNSAIAPGQRSRPKLLPETKLPLHSQSTTSISSSQSSSEGEGLSRTIRPRSKKAAGGAKKIPTIKTPTAKTTKSGKKGENTLAQDPPVTDPPATDPPTTDPPATDPPAIKTPATKTPATKTPAAKTPATKTPATKTPATKTPAKTPARTPASPTRYSVGRKNVAPQYFSTTLTAEQQAERDMFVINVHERHDVSFEAMLDLFNSRFSTDFRGSALRSIYTTYLAPGKDRRPSTLPQRHALRSRKQERNAWIIKKKEKYNEKWKTIAAQWTKRWPKIPMTQQELVQRYYRLQPGGSSRPDFVRKTKLALHSNSSSSLSSQQSSTDDEELSSLLGKTIKRAGKKDNSRVRGDDSEDLAISGSETAKKQPAKKGAKKPVKKAAKKGAKKDTPERTPSVPPVQPPTPPVQPPAPPVQPPTPPVQPPTLPVQPPAPLAQPAHFESISPPIRRRIISWMEDSRLEAAHLEAAFRMAAGTRMSAMNIQRYYNEYLALGRPNRPALPDAVDAAQRELDADNEEREEALAWAHHLPKRYSSVMIAFWRQHSSLFDGDARLMSERAGELRTMRDTFQRFLTQSADPAAAELDNEFQTWKRKDHAMKTLYIEVQRMVHR